jgi:heme-degrading monooxygenase HmoA
MISRHWKGVARRERADDYVRHLQEQTFPAIRPLPGFVAAAILRRDVPKGVEFLVLTQWSSLAAIRAFAGDDVEAAVVPDAVQRMMVEYERRVQHYEVLA